MNHSDRKSSVLIPINLALTWCSVTALLSFARLGSADFGAQGDLPVHYHLLRAYWRSAQAGDWLPHWAGLLDGGRGDAFFTFYPPLSYWLGALLIEFGGLSLINSLKCLTFFALFTAQLNAYIFARSFCARRPSLLVSLSYALLPSYALIALHRAFLPNALALSCLPLVLLGAQQLFSGENYLRYFLLFVLAFSALILTHVIMTYLVGWLLLLMLLCHSQRNIPRLCCATFVALALTSFFWLPQQLEMRWTQVGLQLTQQDFQQHLLFAPLAQDTPFRRAWAGLNDIASWLTILQTALSLTLAAMLWRVKLAPAQQALRRWALGATAFGLLIALPQSAPLWRIIPGLPYIQFPWRWQPVTALAIALLGALAWTHWASIARPRRLWLTPVATLCALCLVALTWQISRAPAPEFQTNELIAQLNRRAFTPPSFETARELPDEIKPLRLAITANQVYFRPATADRLLYPPTENYGGLTILRGRGNVIAQDLANQRRSFQITAAEPLQARLETYAYPHWTAQLDGQALPIQVESATGLMLVELPAGNHALTFEFIPRTATYRCARALSASAWLALLGFALWRWRRLVVLAQSARSSNQ